MIIECDGYIFHRASLEQFAYELKRERELQKLGYRFYRFAASDVVADPWAAAFEVIEVMNEVWPEFSPIRLPPEVSSFVQVPRQSEQQRMGAEPQRLRPEADTVKHDLENEEVSLEEVAERIRRLPLKKETLPLNVDAALRRSYARAYEPWSEQEDLWLARQARVPGTDVDVLCKAFQRNPGSIKSRLRKLGVSEKTYLKKMLGQVNLRNHYRVYEEGGAYVVTSENTKGQLYECEVRPEAVSYLHGKMMGRRITAEQAGRILEPVAERFIKLSHANGDKRRHSGQYVLVAAVVLGQVMVSKEGRSYVYSVI